MRKTDPAAEAERLSDCADLGALALMDLLGPLLEDATLDEQSVLFWAVRLRVEAAIEAFRFFTPHPPLAPSDN